MAEQLKRAGDIYLLLVSEDCPFCAEVLDNINKMHLDLETVIVNTDACRDQVDSLIDWPAVPMIAHFRNGKEVRRSIGLDGIMSFAALEGPALPPTSESTNAYYELAAGSSEAGEEVSPDILAAEAEGGP